MSTTFFIMFYNSNLRQTLVAPTFEFEINGDEDIYNHDIKIIYTDLPESIISYEFSGLEKTMPDMYAKVCKQVEISMNLMTN